MSLTKQDLTDINSIVMETVNACFKQYVVPLHEWSITVTEDLKEIHEKIETMDKKIETMDKKIEAMDKDIKGLSKRMDDHVFDTEEKVTSNTELIGQYVNDFATQKNFVKLEKRVHKLELAAV